MILSLHVNDPMAGMVPFSCDLLSSIVQFEPVQFSRHVQSIVLPCVVEKTTDWVVPGGVSAHCRCHCKHSKTVTMQVLVDDGSHHGDAQ